MTTNFYKLLTLAGLSALVMGACGDDKSNDDEHSPGGKSGRGGAGAGTAGRSVQAGSAGRAGGSATSGAGGSTAGRQGGSGRGGSGPSGAGRGGAAGNGAGEGGNGGQAGPSSCFTATVAGFGDITPSADRGVYANYAASIHSNAFAGEDALLELRVFQPDTGSFALGQGDNANWSTCQQCVIALVDSAPNRAFFADAGTLVIDDASDPLHGLIDATLTNAHFVEVTIEETSPYTSTPVDGGSCLEAITTHVEVSPGDSSGGAGGQGGQGQGAQGGEGGNGGAPEVPDGCVEVSGGEWISDVQSSFGRYLSLISPNLGSPAEDALILGFFSDEVGTFEVGSGIDATYSTCERCFIANVQDSTADGLWFYGISGTLVVEAGSEPMSGVINATATDVTFIQVDPESLETRVDGGACLHLAAATITKP
jgi:hypothetical protein